jgi:hypothetical protein
MSRKHHHEELAPRQRSEDYQKALASDPSTAKRESHADREKRLYAEYIARGEGNTTLNINSIIPTLNIAHIPEGYEYSLQDCMNMAGDSIDYGKLTQLQQVGWDIVEASRHPEIAMAGMDAKFISIGHNVLMDRPIRIAEMDKRRSLESMAQDMMGLNDIAARKYAGTGNVVKETSIKKDGALMSVLSQDLSEYSAPFGVA